MVVTGGGGYLGCLLTPRLLEAGYRVKVLDLLHYGEEPLASFRDHPSFELIRRDIDAHEAIPDLFDGVAAVIHLASLSNDPSCDLDPTRTIRCNFLNTRSLARRAKAAGVGRFIFASSCSVYGAQGESMLDEQSATEPITLYALTKLTVENELMAMADDHFCVATARLATLFGYSPRMRFDLAINIMIKRCLMNEGLVVNGRGEQYRPFLHVADAADVFHKFLTLDAKLLNREVYNIGNEANNYTIQALAEKIQAAFPDQRIEQVLHQPDCRSYNVSFRKAAQRLGIVPPRGVDDCIAELKKACEEGRLSDMNHPRYYNILTVRNMMSAMTLPNMALPNTDPVKQPAKKSVRKAA